jgi:hypothetical protein
MVDASGQIDCAGWQRVIRFPPGYNQIIRCFIVLISARNPNSQKTGSSSTAYPIFETVDRPGCDHKSNSSWLSNNSTANGHLLT